MEYMMIREIYKLPDNTISTLETEALMSEKFLSEMVITVLAVRYIVGILSILFL